MKYKILTQFVKKNVKFDEPVKEAVKEGVEHYNLRSLIARNPKKILEYKFLDNDMTLEIILESEEKLPMPTKALRLLSTYLVKETCVGKGNYLAGKQLFKMNSSEVKDDSKNASDNIYRYSYYPPISAEDSQSVTESDYEYLVNNREKTVKEKPDEAGSLARLKAYMNLLTQIDSKSLEKIEKIDEILKAK